MKMSDADETNGGLVEHIANTLATVEVSTDLAERVKHAFASTQDDVPGFQANVVMNALIFAAEMMEKHGIDEESTMRVTAGLLQAASAILVRSAKRNVGEELCPARFAIVAYWQAEEALKGPEWSSEDEQTFRPGARLRQDWSEAMLRVKREDIAKLDADHAIRVECIARTFRNAFEADGEHAAIAFDLVAAERAARGGT